MNLHISNFLQDTKNYFLITIVGLTILELEPFGDILRGILFGLSVAYSAIFFIYNIKKLKITPLFYIICSFFILSTLSYIVHKDIFKTGFSHLQYLFLFLNASLISSDEIDNILISIAKWLTIYGIFLSLFPPIASELFKNSELMHSFSDTLWQKMINAPYDFPNRYKSVLNENHISLILGTTSIFSLFLFFKNKKISWKIISALNILCSMFFVVFAYASRGSMVLIASAFIIFILCILFLSPKNSEKKIAIILIILSLLVLAILIITFVLSDNVREVMLYKVIRVQNISSGSSRNIRHKLAIKCALKNPIFGVPSSEYKNVFSILDSAQHPHNLYLDVWLSFGTICLILFLAIFVYMLLIFIKLIIGRDKTKENLYLYFIISLFIGLAIQSLVDDCFWGGYYIKGFFLAILFGIACIKKNKEN